MSHHVILGTGALGAALAHELVGRGHRVTTVNRSGRTATLPASVDHRRGDLRDARFLDATLEVADVVHQAAMPAYHRWVQEFPALQAAVLDAAERAGAAVVLGDNLYCYGTPGTTITEDTPEKPTSLKGAVRKRMADDALARHEAGRVRVALSRPADYAGPGYPVMDGLAYGAALRGRTMRFLGRLDVAHSWSSLTDAARAMAAIADAEAWGRAWIAPTLPAITTEDLAARIWAAADKPGEPKAQGLRGIGLRLLGATNPDLRETVEMMGQWDEPYVVDSSRIAAELGVEASPWDEVIEESMRRVRQA